MARALRSRTGCRRRHAQLSQSTVRKRFVGEDRQGLEYLALPGGVRFGRRPSMRGVVPRRVRFRFGSLENLGLVDQRRGVWTLPSNESASNQVRDGHRAESGE